MEKKPAGCNQRPDELNSHSRSVDHAFGGGKPFGTTTGHHRLTDDQAFAELRRRQLDRNR
jgi:hypothetical protein